jgi:hypothetical protein
MTRVSSSTHRDAEVNYDSALGTRVQRGPAYFEPRVALSDEAQQHLGKLKLIPACQPRFASKLPSALPSPT